MENKIFEYGKDVLQSKRFQKGFSVRHHLRYNVAQHSIRVAECAYDIALWLQKRGVKVDPEAVVHSALLHDIGMTDDEVRDLPSYKKLFRHPVRSAEILENEYHCSPEELDAVLGHMWPLSGKAPHHLTGWIVIAADKLCSLREATSKNKKK